MALKEMGPIDIGPYNLDNAKGVCEFGYTQRNSTLSPQPSCGDGIVETGCFSRVLRFGSS
jgi:hypothetical protein